MVKMKNYKISRKQMSRTIFQKNARTWRSVLVLKDRKKRKRKKDNRRDAFSVMIFRETREERENEEINGRRRDRER